MAAFSEKKGSGKKRATESCRRSPKPRVDKALPLSEQREEIPAAPGRCRLHPSKEALREVSLKARAEHFFSGEFDVVFDTFELEALLVGIVDREACAVVEITRLSTNPTETMYLRSD